jgi:hypothetical protein
MDVMIGVDPHKGSHTATMIDVADNELRRITVRSSRRQFHEPLEWADGARPRKWAVECASGMGFSSPSSSSPLARWCWMCRRRWRHGCECSALVARPRPIRTSPLDRGGRVARPGADRDATR